MGPPSSAAISIPTQDATMVNAPGVAGDDSGWPPVGGRSPGRGDGPPPRRSSRSRSPGARNGRDDRDRE